METLDPYADLFDIDRDALADGLDQGPRCLAQTVTDCHRRNKYNDNYERMNGNVSGGKT
jgi:hypothetical protein